MKMFHKPRKSMVAFAIASAVGGVMVSAPVQATNLSPDGLGQVQIFPYYTVKKGHDTYVHLTNTSKDTVAVKIRFREAKNSREVRDFNIVLSPYDMWTGAVTASGEGAKIVTYDKSCTSPRLLDSSTSPGATEVDFTSIAYDGSSADYKYDNGGTSIARTQEGYFEVIAMGASSESVSASSNVVEFNAKHVNGVPRDCDLVDAAFDGTYGAELSGEPEFENWTAAGNVLKGFSTLINVASGQAVGVEPTTLANFTTSTLLYPPGDLLPDLSSGVLSASYVADNGTLVSWSANPLSKVDAVSALLQRRYVINEYSSTTAGTTGSDWVLTFPTKHNYVDDAGDAEVTPALPGIARAPFDEWFAKNTPVLTDNSGKLK